MNLFRYKKKRNEMVSVYVHTKDGRRNKTSEKPLKQPSALLLFNY